MGPGIVGWFTSSHNVAGVALGKSRVLNVIVMSGATSGDRQERAKAMNICGGEKCVFFVFFSAQMNFPDCSDDAYQITTYKSSLFPGLLLHSAIALIFIKKRNRT